ncbi:MAG: gene transfer agent family protein [Rhizobiaceae bacterium]
MMVNARRGEISATLDGKDWRLCLTLGALAELETAFGASDLVALGDRFATGRLSANDMIAIIAAGLGGAGNTVSTQDVGAMYVEGGLGGFADIVSRLLVATFDQGAVGQREALPANP